mmetsp:Transcript_25611/g.60030  ORF Transcript_25611/g.60030 Transcript_25611/m.60030 type:complete len:589 (+) Transcript_25611:158-1924(+)
MCSRVFGDTNVWGCPGSGKDEPPPSSRPSSSSNRSTRLRTLELSSSMHPQYITFQIYLALNKSTYNGISCFGLNFLENEGGEADDENEKNPSGEASPAMYINPLKVLIHSRRWLRLEFHRCLGVESLLWLPAKANAAGDDDVGTGPAKAANTTEVDSILLKFSRSLVLNVDSYDAERHRNFFADLLDHWKVRRLSLSMHFCPDWTREFCHRRVSSLEGLEFLPDCTWHNGESAPAEESDDVNDDINDDDVNDDAEQNEGIRQKDTPEAADCWEIFCRKLGINHPHLRSLEVGFKLPDVDLAYLIDHAVAPVADAGESPVTSSAAVLPIEKLHFGKWCCCGDRSLRALSRALESPSGRRWRSLTMSRGTKLPSRAAIEAGYRHAIDRDGERALLAFCRALKHATALSKLDLGDYVLDERTLGAIFESLAAASAPIERLSLFHCATTSSDVFGRVLSGVDGGGGADSSSERGGPAGSSSAMSPLIQNRLPSLRMLYLSKDADKALCRVLKSNTSITSISNHRRTKTHEYYLDLNRGGRRILTASSSVLSPSLWPRILERAGTRNDLYCGGENRKHDVVHCLLRNRILLEL